MVFGGLYAALLTPRRALDATVFRAGRAGVGEESPICLRRSLPPQPLAPEYGRMGIAAPNCPKCSPNCPRESRWDLRGRALNALSEPFSPLEESRACPGGLSRRSFWVAQNPIQRVPQAQSKARACRLAWCFARTESVRGTCCGR